MFEAVLWGLLIFSVSLIVFSKFSHVAAYRYPVRLPVVGHLYLLIRHRYLHHALACLSDRYGPSPLLLYFGSRRTLVVSSSAAVRQCFTYLDLNFTNRPMLLSGIHLNYNCTTMITLPYGPEWINLRRFAALHIFSPAHLQAFSQLLSNRLRVLLRSLFRGGGEGEGFQQVDWRWRMKEVVLDSLMEMIIGRRQKGEGNELVRMIDEAFQMSAVVSPEELLPWLSWMGTRRQMQRLEKELDAQLQGMVDEKRGERAAEGDRKQSMMDMMLDDPHYTDTTIKGMVQNMLLAGTDTTTTTLEWAMALLLNHSHLLQKLHREIEAHVGHSRLVDPSDLPSLRCVTNVIKETLRLYPPGPLLVPRESVADCEVGGVAVPRGTMLIVNAHKLHRDPELWEEPMQFKPERFEREGEGKGHKYVPFGCGRRRCPGEAMALSSIGLVLASLVQCFEWKRVGEEEVDLTEEPGFTVPLATPLLALCKPRDAMVDLLAQL
ncbi:cytochrome P450 81Q32-like [Zingiber officinale]|uniref:Cytochrome P450 n=1 Tax=Zingiber officinale TaxID=94328 RepID=A0A8J5H4U5_ZINOF|nr:cytochrome P450 81Q32-like [Zingiber officinale]KAG6509700.1 hypothetical protein ZIOFF_027700 [Zingiber officinale]